QTQGATAVMYDGSNNSVDILFVGFVGGTGGASSLMLDLAARMAARGVRVRIVVPAYDTTVAYTERGRQRAVAVERSPWLVERGLGLRKLIDAVRFVRGCHAPVVHFHLGNTNTIQSHFLWAMDMLRLPPVYVTPHTNMDDPPADDPRARRWAEAATRRLKKVICVSERSRSRQIDYGLPPEKVELIRNGVDVAAFSAGNPLRARESLGLDGDVPIILVSSRIEREKRPVDAVRALSLIAPEFPEAHLVFIGQGSFEDEARAAARKAGLNDRVHFPGFQSNVADWLAAARVWLLPTESEGFSVAMLEALAAGCPVVSTICPGNDELLIDEENALLAKVGNIEEIAVALRRLLSDERLRARLGANARSTAQQYSLDKTVEEHLACYAGD
ncbi:MAG TPA: glycosyltransferase family 4 protein, partial [Blastocatellia bacterium]|nr:glycosyltransferase family 4 protein [Blastocatellia bacterium]